MLEIDLARSPIEVVRQQPFSMLKNDAPLMGMENAALAAAVVLSKANPPPHLHTSLSPLLYHQYRSSLLMTSTHMDPLTPIRALPSLPPRQHWDGHAHDHHVEPLAAAGDAADRGDGAVAATKRAGHGEVGKRADEF